jgi:PAS domain S-box-containing protein
MWQLSPSVIIEAVTALGLLIVAIYFPWRDLNRSASRVGSVLLIFSALWILTHSLEIGTPIASYKDYLMGLQLIWGLLALTLWLIYILHYIAPGKWQTGRIYALFGVIPLLAIAALATNHIYGLMWTSPGLNINNPYLPLEPVYGLFYWFSMIYMAVLIVYGSFVVINKVVLQHNFRRWEPWILIWAVVIPILAAFLEVTGVTRSANLTIGLTPLVSGIGAIALVLTLPRFHLQKVIPLARQTVFEHISNGVVVLDMQNRVVDLNPVAEQMAGYTSLEALGLPVEQLWSNWPSQLKISKLTSTGYLELELNRAEEQRTYSLQMYIITDLKNRPMNKLVILSDATESIRAEEEKEKRAAELIVANKELLFQNEEKEKRAAELAAANKELLFQNEEREKMQEHLIVQDRLASIGQLVSGIAHEMNNPLTGVIGFSELLMKRTDLPDDAKADLKIVNGEAQRTARVVKGLLIFARKQKTEKESLDINSIIQSVLQLRSYEYKVSNIEVDTQLAPELPQVLGNNGQLQQVFINLIVNAEQAMLEAHNKGTLTIVTERVGDIIKASITDDGPGISPENMKKLFTPFFTTKEVGKGTGLGLSICYGIVTEHGGKIYVESEPGKGTTFVVELPINK